MRRPIQWGWLTFVVVYLVAGAALLWFAVEVMEGYR